MGGAVCVSEPKLKEESAMAKEKEEAEEKKTQTTMGDIVPKVPKAVQENADAYASALRSLGRSKGKLNTAKDVLILAMKDADVSEVQIDSGNKRITLTAKDQLKIKKVTSPHASGDDDDGDDE